MIILNPRHETNGRYQASSSEIGSPIDRSYPWQQTRAEMRSLPACFGGSAPPSCHLLRTDVDHADLLFGEQWSTFRRSFRRQSNTHGATARVVLRRRLFLRE